MKELTKEKQLHGYFIYFRLKGNDELKRVFIIAYNRKSLNHIFRIWATAKGIYDQIKEAYVKLAPKSKINNSLLDREHYDKQFETLKELFKKGTNNHDRKQSIKSIRRLNLIKRL